MESLRSLLVRAKSKERRVLLQMDTVKLRAEATKFLVQPELMQQAAESKVISLRNQILKPMIAPLARSLFSQSCCGARPE
eukprot:SAG22_NODE_670_length_7987_cov_2.733519_3_plen_80_part_00